MPSAAGAQPCCCAGRSFEAAAARSTAADAHAAAPLQADQRCFLLDPHIAAALPHLLTSVAPYFSPQAYTALLAQSGGSFKDREALQAFIDGVKVGLF